MGHRTVMRVPLDFDHPRNEVWPGYLSPPPRPCPAGDACFNGETVDGKWLGNIAQLLTVLSDDGSPRRHNNPTGIHPHPYVTSLPHPPRSTAPVARDWTGYGDRYEKVPGCVPPTEAFTSLVSALCGREPSFLGHDAVDKWRVEKALLAAAGMPEDAFTCPECDGLAYHPDDDAMLEAWEPTEPPVGPGWQLWETTSEGSPVSPVFESPEALAEWCEDNASWFAGEKTTKENWFRMFINDTTDIDTMLVYTIPDTAS